MSENKVICDCNGVFYEDIVTAVNNGATTAQEVGEVTGAGTVCGGCLDAITEVIDALSF